LVPMAEQRPSFDTCAEAEAFCREREEADPDGSWMPFESAGRWTAVRTNLPRNEDATGSATAAKPKPPDPEDPRSDLGRNLGPYAG
jgi:hypothetical protein